MKSMRSSLNRWNVKFLIRNIVFLRYFLDNKKKKKGKSLRQDSSSSNSRNSSCRSSNVIPKSEFMCICARTRDQQIRPNYRIKVNRMSKSVRACKSFKRNQLKTVRQSFKALISMLFLRKIRKNTETVHNWKKLMCVRAYSFCLATSISGYSVSNNTTHTYTYTYTYSPNWTIFYIEEEVDVVCVSWIEKKNPL